MKKLKILSLAGLTSLFILIALVSSVRAALPTAEEILIKEEAACKSKGGFCATLGSTGCNSQIKGDNGFALNCGPSKVCCSSKAGSAAQITKCSSLGGTCVPASACSSKSDSRAQDCGQGGICCGTKEQYPLSMSSGLPAGGAASSAVSTGTAVVFENPIGANSVSEFIGSLLSNLQGIIVMIAIVMIVVGGLMYMLSAGNEGMIKTAKNTIAGALIGLAIALAAPTFLKTIVMIFEGNGSGASADDIVNRALTLRQIAIKVLNFLLSIAGIVAIIGLVIGGTFYMTAYGDKKRIDKGKEIITASIIGIAITLAAVIIVRQVATLLGVR